MRYSVTALCSRYRGDYISANVFFSQARMHAGALFDVADVDAVMGFILMSNYCSATLEIPLSAHYANQAWNILKLVLVLTYFSCSYRSFRFHLELVMRGCGISATVP